MTEPSGLNPEVPEIDQSEGAAPPPPPPPAPEIPATEIMAGAVTEDERLWSAVCHAAIGIAFLLAFLNVPFLALAIPVAIYFWKSGSKFVKFHAAQALAFQIAVMAILTVLAVLSVPLMLILIGFALMGVVILLGFAAMAYGLYAALQIKQGKDFRYPVVADFVQKHLQIEP